MPFSMARAAPMHLSRADRNAAAALLGSPSDPSFHARAEYEDEEGSFSPVGESNVEGLPNSQLSDFADALEEVGVRAVSTEWHVHLVREAESQQQFRRDSLAGKCQLCVQCPNGRKHSSLFAIHLLPHWLGSRLGRGAEDPPQDTPMTCSGIKTSAMAIDKLTDPDPAQHCLVGAELSDWLTGEVYHDSVVFSTHPNGHLFGDKQTDMLQMPICACMKALMKIKRPLDPRNPSEQLPLHKLSTLKLTLSVKFTRGGISWEQDFISPGVIKLVSRVTDRALEDAESVPRFKGRREEDIAKQEEEMAAAILLGRPAPSSVTLTRFPAPPTPVPAAAPAPLTLTVLTPQQELRREAHKHSELFLRAFAHHPEAALCALEALLTQPPNPALPSRARKRPMPMADDVSPTDYSPAPGSALPPAAHRHEGARTRRCSAVGGGAGSSYDERDERGGDVASQGAAQQLFDLIDDDARGEGPVGGEGLLMMVGAESMMDPAGAAPRE